MIIELPTTPREGERPCTFGLFFFANNNLAIRRECFDSLGGYDERLSASEDVDLCFALSRQSTWVAARERAAVVLHHPRLSMRSFMRQMWTWGWELGAVYKKLGHRGIFLHWIPKPNHVRACELPHASTSSLLVICFFTYFHLAHLFLGLALLATSAQLLFLFLALLCFSVYLYQIFPSTLSYPMALRVVGLNYCANVVFLSAAFIGGLVNGLLFIPASIFRPEPSAGGACGS